MLRNIYQRKVEKISIGINRIHKKIKDERTHNESKIKFYVNPHTGADHGMIANDFIGQNSPNNCFIKIK